MQIEKEKCCSLVDELGIHCVHEDNSLVILAVLQTSEYENWMYHTNLVTVWSIIYSTCHYCAYTRMYAGHSFSTLFNSYFSSFIGYFSWEIFSVADDVISIPV